MRVVGFTYWADTYCADCGAHLPETDPEGNAKHPLYSWELSEFTYEQDGETYEGGCGECFSPMSEW